MKKKLNKISKVLALIIVCFFTIILSAQTKKSKDSLTQNPTNKQIIISQFFNITLSLQNMTYISGTPINSGGPIEITAGGDVRIQFGVEVNNPDGAQGTVRVFSKKSSTASFEVEYGGSDIMFSGTTYNYFSRDHILNASDFNATGGTFYAQFENSAGVKWNTPTYSVIVNDNSISNNTISGNQTIIQGQTPSTLTGSTPTGGSGNYVYRWRKRTTGSWSDISGATATSQNYSPGILNTTTSYRRRVYSSGFPYDESNIVVITTTDNTICCSQIVEFDQTPATIIGNAPQGATGYNWHSRTLYNGNYSGWANTNVYTKDYTFSHPIISYASNIITYEYRRYVGGLPGTYEDGHSNTVSITLNPDPNGIYNNIVTENAPISGSGVLLTGSTPTGGSGNYTYQWYYTMECDSYWGNWYNEPLTYQGNSQNFTVPQQWIDDVPCMETTFFHRYVTDSDGNSTVSNSINIYGGDSSDYFSAKTSPNLNDDVTLDLDGNVQLNEESIIKIFPNPATDFVNFTISHKKDKRITIKITSLVNYTSYEIFNGVVNENDWMFEWNVPYKLKNGLYTYQIMLDEELVSGKLVLE